MFDTITGPTGPAQNCAAGKTIAEIDLELPGMRPSID